MLIELGFSGPGKVGAQSNIKNNQKGMSSEKKETRRTKYGMKQISIPFKENYAQGEPSVKRLMDSEFRVRLDKGVYFRCNEKYSHGHRCKIKENRELMLIILNEEEDLEEAATNGNKETKMKTGIEIIELKTLEVMGEMKIALQTILGFTSKGTMKLK